MAVLMVLTMQISEPEQPPQILQIHREAMKPGNEAAYADIEEQITRICFEMKCPHPYLGIEAFTGRKEVWFLNGYGSSAEQQKVREDYASNPPLIAALTEASKRKAALTEAPFEVFANYRPDLTGGAPWLLGRGRFLVITVTKANGGGTVFEAPDDTRLIIRPAKSRQEATEAAAKAGSEARAFEVHPTWSTPAKEWIEADPAFWRSYPPAR